MAKVEEKTPYVVVAFQECERMNVLLVLMKNSLKELDLGFKVTIFKKVSKKRDVSFKIEINLIILFYQISLNKFLFWLQAS